MKYSFSLVSIDVPMNMLPEVSVIVCFRNEEKRILAFLEALAAQSFTAFECILVDDFSTDNTSEIVTNFFQHTTLQWQIIPLKEHLPETAEYTANKKQGITLAVAQCRAPLVLLTDADCVPQNLWITTMVSAFEAEQSSLAFGPVQFTERHSLLNAFQEIDLVAMMVLTAWTISHQLPMLGNAANMLFLKASFIELNGYNGNENVASGDDIFFLQKCIQSGKRVTFVEDETAIVSTPATATLQAFIQQRIRWAGKSTAYRNVGVQMALAVIYLFNVAMLCLLASTCFGFLHPLFFLSAFVVKLIIDTLIIFPGLVFFNRKKLILGMPLFECMHILYVVCIGFLSLKKSYIWKGREIKQ